MILDVGCGNRPRGDINLDRYKNVNPEIEQYESVLVNSKKIPNFILADALNLPFPDNSFDKVLCYHVIEHTKNPIKLIKELLRVGKNEIIIKCPHRFSKFAKMPYHKHYFRRKWFTDNFKCNMEISLSYWSPLKFLGLIRLPNEMTIKVRKEI